MSSAATVTRKIYDGYDGSTYVIPAEQTPTASTLAPTMWRQIFALAAGTYELANLKKGQVVLIDAEGTVVLNDAAGTTTICTITSGTMAEITAISDDGDFAFRMLASELPTAKYNTSSTVTSEIPAAGKLTGARHVYYENTADGAKEITTRTATELFGDVSGAFVGMTFLLTIVNRGNNTVTLTGGDDVTVSGEATIATLVTRTYVCTFNSATTLTMVSVNKGTIET